MLKRGDFGITSLWFIPKLGLQVHPWDAHIQLWDLRGLKTGGHIPLPFGKRDPERLRGISELKASDKGGMIFQPAPGVYENVHELDFTSLYPSIIVNYGLSH
jgi:hypothetical protein